jgi:hypothetical protein
MSLFLFLLSFFLMIGTSRSQDAAGEKPPAYVLVASAAKKVKADVTVEIKAPKVRADEWMLYVPKAAERPGQLDVRTTLLPRGRPARDLSEYARPLLADRRAVASLPLAKRQELTVRVEYRATLLARRLERRGPGASTLPAGVVALPDPPLDPRERRFALASDHQFDFEEEGFRAWLDEHKLARGEQEDAVDFARRVFLEIRRTLTWFASPTPDHLASHVAKAGKTDDIGATVLYVSALRARGIPARLLAGRRVAPTDAEPSGSRPDEPRIRAEFHAEGVGWVPVDIATATFRDESPEAPRRFGVDDGDDLVVHQDTDFVVETYFGRKTVEWIPAVSFWVIGSGTLNDLESRALLKAQAEPVDLETALPHRPATTRKPQPKR